MITITWYGHAALDVETGGTHILVDPFLSDNPAASTGAGNVPANFILLTHGHHDHLGDTVEIAHRTGAQVACNVEIAAWLREQGLQTAGLAFGEETAFRWGLARLVPAIHGTGLPDGSDGGKPGGFLLTIEDKNLYIAGDTALFDGMKEIGAAGLMLAVLPIGGYYTMDPDQALQAVKLLNPKYAIPYHYNTWDKIRQDPQAWSDRVKQETSTNVQVLKPGGTFHLE